MVFEIVIIQTTRFGREVEATPVGPLSGGKFSSRAAAQKFLRENRADIAGRETSVGVREFKSRPSVPRTPRGQELIGPVPSERGRKLKRERETKELAQQAIKKVEEKIF